MQQFVEEGDIKFSDTGMLAAPLKSGYICCNAQGFWLLNSGHVSLQLHLVWSLMQLQFTAISRWLHQVVWPPSKLLALAATTS